MRSSSYQPRVLLRGLVILMMVVVVLYWGLCVSFVITSPNTGNDFLSYYTAALALRDDSHATIYDLDTLRAAAAAHGVPLPTLLYIYPPVLAIVLIPFTLLPYHVALVTWTVLGCVFWLGGTLLLMRWAVELLGVTRDTSSGERATGGGDIALFASAMTLCMSLTFFPLLDGLLNGQVTSLIFFLTLLALVVLARRPGLTGGFLAAAMWIKLYPILLIGYYALARRWRVVIGAIAGAALILAGMLALIGWQGVRASSAFLGNGAIAGSNPTNLSLQHVPVLLSHIAGQQASGAFLLPGYALCAAVATVFASGVFYIQGRRSALLATCPETPCVAGMPLRDLLGYSWALCTMVLLSPVAWEHTYAWMLPSCVICSCAALRSLLAGSHTPTQPDLTRRKHTKAAKATKAGLSGNLVLLVSSQLAYAFLALPAFLSVAGAHSAQLMRLNYLLLLFHPLGGLILWSVNTALFFRTLPRVPALLQHTAGAQPTQPTRTLVLVRTFAGYFAIVCLVDALYWGIFIFISTH